MNKSIKETFPLEENVLSSSLFDEAYTIEIDEHLRTGNIDDDIMIVASNSILGLS